MPHRVKVSSKHQIAIPAAVRRRLAIDAGDHLLVEIQDGTIVLIPEPKDAVQELKGLYREIWEGVDIQDYIDQERDSW
jgi:AbrB family looped-hinge helix DNA binding protein